MKRTARWIFAAIIMFTLFHYNLDITPVQLLSKVDDRILLAVQPDDSCCQRPCENQENYLNNHLLSFLKWKWS